MYRAAICLVTNKLLSCISQTQRHCQQQTAESRLLLTNQTLRWYIVRGSHSVGSLHFMVIFSYFRSGLAIFYFFPLVSMSISMAIVSSFSWYRPHPNPIRLGSIQCLISWMLAKLSRSGSCILLWFLKSLRQTSMEKRIEKTPAPANTGPGKSLF